MRKNLNLLLAFAVCALCAPGVQAGTPESAAFIDRGRSLFDFGRWTDARHEFLQARETLSPADREAAQDRKSTRLNSSHYQQSRMPSSA